MDYYNLSLEELKQVAKSKGISIGNIGKEKLIEKLSKFDIDKKNKDVVDTLSDLSDYENANLSVGTTGLDVKSEKTNVIEEITNIVTDLDEFEESESFDSNIEEIGLEEEVVCMSITFGGLNYTSPITGAKYKWHNIGDVQSLTVRELVAMNNSKPAFLNKPWIVLKDHRAVNKFRLLSKYEEVAKISQLKKLFDNGNIDSIKKTIDTALSNGMRDVVISKIRNMYNNGSLNNTHIIKILEDRLRFDIATE